MEKIPVKQIEGAVDTMNVQQINARKHFSVGATFESGLTGHYPYVRNGFLHFQKNITLVTDNDFRLGVDAVLGLVVLEQYVGGTWVKTSLNGGFSPVQTILIPFGSVAYGTSITLATGLTKNAENMEIGDVVSAISSTSNLSGLLSGILYVSPPTTAVKVTGVLKNTFDYYFKINNTFKVSARHHLLVNRSTIVQYVRADFLVIGDKILNYSTGWVNVGSILRVNEPLSMVNIRLENYDTYIASSIVVKNIEEV